MRLSRLRSRKASPKRTNQTARTNRPRRATRPVRKTVSSKARNWLHAKARSARLGHRPRTVFIGIVSGLFSTILLGLWLSGHLGDVYRVSQTYAQTQLLNAGFGVKHIDISGARLSSEAEVRKVLGVEKGELVFAVDLKAARERVESLGWVHKASVTRLLPDRIAVVISERTPFAVWQNQRRLSLISAEGARISTISKNQYSNLPFIVGAGAQKQAASLLSDLATRRKIANNVHSIIWISNRRWNINLHSGAQILLPASQWQQALDKLTRSDEMLKLLELPEVVVDARVAGRFSIRFMKRPPGKSKFMMS